MAKFLLIITALFLAPNTAFGSESDSIAHWKVKTKVCDGQDVAPGADEFRIVVTHELVNLLFLDMITVPIDAEDSVCRETKRLLPERYARHRDVPTDLNGAFELVVIRWQCWKKIDGQIAEKPYRDDVRQVAGPTLKIDYHRVSETAAILDADASPLCNGKKTHLELTKL